MGPRQPSRSHRRRFAFPGSPPPSSQRALALGSPRGRTAAGHQPQPLPPGRAICVWVWAEKGLCEACLRADRASVYHAAYEAPTREDAFQFEYDGGLPILLHESVPGPHSTSPALSSFGTEMTEL